MQTSERPVICHVEVGGTLGGSFLALERYLKHTDPNRFNHEVVFYQRPPEVGTRVAGRWPTVSLGLPVPRASTASAAGKGAAHGNIRAFLKNHPFVYNVVNTVRLVARLVRQLPQDCGWRVSFASVRMLQSTSTTITTTRARPCWRQSLPGYQLYHITEP